MRSLFYQVLYTLICLTLSANSTAERSEGELHPEGNVELCFHGDTTEEEVRKAHENARSRGFQGISSRTRPIQRIGVTAYQPSGSPSGRGLTISWSYVPDGTVLPPASAVPDSSAPSVLLQTLDAEFGSRALWHQLFVNAFDKWSSVTGITYVYEPNDDGAAFVAAPGVAGVRGDVRVAMRAISSAVIGYNYLPNSGSDMVLDVSNNNFGSWANNRNAFLSLINHEHGHGLGLAHVCPTNNSKLMEPFLVSFTGPGIDDIWGGQVLYGDKTNGTGAHAGRKPIASTRNVLLGVQSNGDADWFDVIGGGVIRITVKPEGAAYLEGPQNGDICSSGQLIDIRTNGNLAITAYREDGITQIASADINGLAAPETLVYRVPAGSNRSSIRVTATGSNYQLYRLIGGNVTEAVAGNTASGGAPEIVFASGFE
jgi:hypothetical protein